MTTLDHTVNVYDINPSVQPKKKTAGFCEMIMLFIAVAVFSIGLAAPTLYFGYHDKGSTCQEGERAGMTLSTWTIITGFSHITSLGLVGLGCINAVVSTNKVVPNILLFILTLDLFWYISWSIIGVVILATNENNNCVSQGKGMAVMAIINIVLFELRGVYYATITILADGN